MERKTLKVWDVETGRMLRTLCGHSAGVSGVVVSGDRGQAVSASLDKTLKVWDVESGRASCAPFTATLMLSIVWR
jgi:WD40 repeat protein